MTKPTSPPNPSSESAVGAGLKWDQELDEPYIPLPSHPTLRLTPLRRGDENALTELCNDPEVGRWSLVRPYPYHRPDAEWWVDHVLADYPRYFPQLKESLLSGSAREDSIAISQINGLRFVLRYVPILSTSAPAPATSAPQSVSPESKSKTSSGLEEIGIRPGQVIGSIHLWPLGDTDRAPSEQTWEIAYDLIPRTHGRGIGKAMIMAWKGVWEGFMRIGKVVAHVESANPASSAVIGKCGFRAEKRWMQEWPAEKGGGERELVEWVWEREE